MILLTSAECRGKLKLPKKENIAVVVDTLSEYRANYYNLMSCDAIIYKGDLLEYIAEVSPSDSKKVLLHYTGNPDIVNVELLTKLREYNVLMSVPSDYTDMQHLYELNQMYPNIRFCGGNFIYLDDINLGVFPTKKVKRVILTDTYSEQDDVRGLSELNKYEFLPVQVKQVGQKGAGIKSGAKAQKCEVVGSDLESNAVTMQVDGNAVIVGQPTSGKQGVEKSATKVKAKKPPTGIKTGGLSMF